MGESTVDRSKRHQRVGLLIELHRWEEALAELGPILAEDSGNYDALCQKALCHFYLGQSQAGYDTTKRAIETGPDHEWAYRIQSHIFSANGEANRALDAAKICVEKAPYLFEAQLTLFYALINYGLLSEARWTLETLSKLSPESAAAQAARGCYGLKIEDFDFAETAFLRALKLQPDDANVLNDLGSVYHEMYRSGRGRRYKKMSVEMFERAVKAEPTFKLAQKNIGLVKQKPPSRVQIAGLFAIFVFLASSPLQSLLYFGFTSHKPLREAYKDLFSPSQGDLFIVVLNAVFMNMVMIGVFLLFRYMTIENKKRFREQYATPAFWKAFLCLNVGMIATYCVALYQAESEVNAFPGIAIRVFAVAALISIVRLVNIRQTEREEIDNSESE